MSQPAEQEFKDMQEALRRADERYNQATHALSNLTYWSNRLNNLVATICEAHLAGDQALVQQLLDQTAINYRARLKPPMRVH